ncbi:IlvD/Edd family dehydratase [Nonomuraea gerenzanensis]|uniref:Xylonate dehydratase n=1 Tax=Nonomuraea gerenzanensis TaxID=93944 RepID=A0A1M4EQQ8_9ACTN|nr:IlvD/Edd family dehydratase [Nonomuraea gerenzanensis]UBU12603.1 dihydroxy-acid dehydratase family protein [Nonomuraea gerenzanensis]SBP01158.1 Xylonate dehydratase [Nonomuraea gerenzanensis]
MSATEHSTDGLRSQAWWDNAGNPEMTALYLERFLNFGLTPDELRSGRPVIGIAQTGSDLVPCNRHHLDLAGRVRDGIRDNGGIPLEFPVHPLQETGKRPTAALDRNLAYLGLVEVLYGYPLDGVVLTTGCDKTTPACLTAAATVNLPAIVLSGGPMLNGYHQGRRMAASGSGLVIWQSKRLLATGEIDYDEFMARVCASAPSIGHCNTMGTALSMNSLAEALGMSLPGCAAIPAPYRRRAQMAYETGRRAVDLVREDLTPRKIMTMAAFENAIVVASALAASTNVPVHLNAIARHTGVPLTIQDWQRVGADVPVLANVAPAGEFLGEDFYRAGGVPAVMWSLLQAGRLHGDALTVSGRTVAENLAEAPASDPEVIRPFAEPLAARGGLLVMTGNLFDSAVMKTSVLPDGFPLVSEYRAIVFEGPEDYHARIDDPGLGVDAGCILVIRYTGPIGYPGSAEVVNMEVPAALLRMGVTTLPTLGDGRQSGTSDAPSILNASPEAAAGGNLAILRTGDRIRVDLGDARVDVLLTEEEIAERWAGHTPPVLENQTPWQEIYRATVGQLDGGGCLELALSYHDLVHTKGIPRDSH